MEQEKHVGVIAIIVHNRMETAEHVNGVLTEFGDIIVARVGVPYPARALNIIALVVDGTTDQIGSITGKLGQIHGVTVRATLAKS